MSANKNLLKKLLINLLDNRLNRLEKRNVEEIKNLDYAKIQFKNQKSFLNQISKKVNEKITKNKNKLNSSNNSLINKSQIIIHKGSQDTTKVRTYPKYSYQNNKVRNAKTPSKPISKFAATADNWRKRNSKYNNIKSRYMDESNKLSKSIVQQNKDNRKLFLTPEPRLIKKRKTKDRLNINKLNFEKNDKKPKENMNNIKTQNNLKKERIVSDIDLCADEITFVLKEKKKKERKQRDSEDEEESESEDKNTKNSNKNSDNNMDSSIEKNNDNKEILIKFGNYLKSSEGDKIAVSIASFLDMKTKYNFFSCSKKFINNLLIELNNIHNNILTMNKMKSVNSIEEEINNINNKFKDENFDSLKYSFKLSKGSLKALTMLDDEKYNDIFKIEELNPPVNEIILIYRIFFQLIDKEELTEIESDKKFWNEARNYFMENANGKIGSFIKEYTSEFDFTKKNIYKLKKLSNGKEDKLKPVIYENFCKTTGLVTFVIKEALEYCGIIFNEKKLMPNVFISYLEYIKENLNECKEYINFLSSIK